jgi:phosphoribosylglycinamide formyltransferase 1
MNIAVFCSGNGSNFQAIVNAEKIGVFKAKIELMVCDNSDAYAIKRAEKANVPCLVLDRREFALKEAFENRIIKELESKNIGLICLAGYMRLLSSGFVQMYKGKIINVHPALLPAFKGADAIRDAFCYGVKISGVTIHFVTEDIDAGPIILQESIKIEDGDTEDIVADKIHKIEHALYPCAIKLFVEGRLLISEGKVYIKD